MNRFITPVLTVVFSCCIAWPAFAFLPGRWSDFEILNDNAKNGIDFSWKRDCKRVDDKACIITWKWRNRYLGKANITYRIVLTGEQGRQVVQRDLTLNPGVSPEYNLTGESLEEVQVGVEKKEISGFGLTSYSEAEKEKTERSMLEQKQKDEIKLHEAEQEAKIQLGRLREQERQEIEQVRRKDLERKQREEAEEKKRRQNQEERRHEVAEERRFNEQLHQGNESAMAIASQPDMISNALQNQNRGFDSIREQNRQREELQRREREVREREAREEQHRRTEEAANQRREAEENRRLQQQRAQESASAAQERQERADQERVAREAERKTTATKQAKEQAERAKQKKEQIALNTSGQYTESSSSSYALTAEQRQIQLQQLAQAQQKQQQALPPQQQQPPQQTQTSETCPPQIWDEYNKDKTQFTVYVLNTCQKSRLEVTSINYYDMEHVLCNTMPMPDRFQPGSKVIPLDCRQFANTGETWRFPGYKVIYRIIY